MASSPLAPWAQRDLDEARASATPPERLAVLCKPPSAYSAVQAARSNPSLLLNLLEDFLRAGDLDAWANPQTPLVLLTRPNDFRLLVGSRNALVRWRDQGSPHLVEPFRAVVVPMVRAWWEAEVEPRELGVYLDGLRRGQAIGSDAHRRNVQLTLHLVRALVPALSSEMRAEVEDRAERVERWLAEGAKAKPYELLRNDLSAWAADLEDRLDEEKEAANPRHHDLTADYDGLWAAKALEIGVQGLVAAAVDMAKNAFPQVLPIVDRNPAAERRWKRQLTAELRALVGPCPLPDALCG